MLTIGLRSALALERRAAGAAGGRGGAVILLRAFWPLFAQNFRLFIWSSRCGFYSIMAFSFGRSLCGKAACRLCTQLADKVHGPLSALESCATRAA